MITGIGIDMVDLERIQGILERTGDRFIHKVFTEREMRTTDVKEVGGKFAAKEAFVKAMGTGFKDVRFKDIEVLNDERGKPYYNISGELNERFKGMAAHLSITHEKGYAAAVAVLERL